MVQTQAKTKESAITIPSKTARLILEELRLLRNEVTLLLPQDDLKDYTHPSRIKRSYQKAVKKYHAISL